MPNDTTPTKICYKCGQEYPATTEFFHANKTKTDGLTGRCKPCARAYQHEHYQANREKRQEQIRAYTQANQEKTREYRQQYYQVNREKVNEKHRAYYQVNREASRVRLVRRRARKRSLLDTFTLEQWRTCLEYFHHTCAVCGSQLRDLFGNIEPHADHWIPLSSDECPGTVADNMVCLCSECNRSKFAKPPEQWLIEKFGKRKALQILERVNAYFEWVRTAI